jgi:hypothetical protein
MIAQKVLQHCQVASFCLYNQEFCPWKEYAINLRAVNANNFL